MKFSIKDLLSISPCSVRICENVDQNNSEYGHFLHGGDDLKMNPTCLGDISRRTWSIENITELRPKHEKKYKLSLFE